MARLGKFFYISVAPTFDSDAQAFFDRVTTAGGTLTTTEKNATNQLVLDMKAAGIWSAMRAVYPMVGASAAACAQNLKSSSFTGTFTSGWTFASTGVTPNGSSAYMDTNFNANTSLTSMSNAHLSVYSRTNNIVDGYDIGCSQGAYQYLLGLAMKGSATDGYYFVNDLLPSSNASANSLGLQTLSRVNNTEVKLNRNSDARQTITKATITIPNFNLYIGALNLGGTANRFTNRQYAFGSIGDGLTDTQASNFYTAVQAFQTTLNRQIAP